MELPWRKADPDALTRTRVGLPQLANFTHQLVAMLDSGMQLVSALDAYARGDPTPLGSISEALSRELSQGRSLVAALGRYPRVFSPVYLGLVRAGETTGELSRMMKKLADLVERQGKFQRKILAAMTYPIFLIGAGLVCAGIFMLFILPALEPFFQSVDVSLPLPTRMLMFLGDVVHHPLVWLGLPLLAGALWWAWPELLRTRPALAERIHNLPLVLPKVGPLTHKIIGSRLLFTLATLLEAGVTLNAALEVCAGVTGNPIVARKVRAARLSLGQGATLVRAFETHGLLTPAVRSLMSVGEETSSLNELLRFSARIYEEDVNYALTGFLALMEPVLLMVMGLGAGFLVLAAVLPIARIIESL